MHHAGKFCLYFCKISENKSDVAILIVLQLCIICSAYMLHGFLTSYRTKIENPKFCEIKQKIEFLLFRIDPHLSKMQRLGETF